MSTLLADLADEMNKVDQALDALLESEKTVRVFIRNPLVTPRRATHHLIICGNCAGDERLPRKTFLAADSTCATCGGRSYVLASTIRFPKKGKEPDERETDRS
jgi:hypothetical protein